MSICVVCGTECAVSAGQRRCKSEWSFEWREVEELFAAADDEKREKEKKKRARCGRAREEVRVLAKSERLL
eukprot:1257425-Rhodomonas_salina.1